MDFLLATASAKIGGLKSFTKANKIAAYIVGATTPCARLYAFLGKQMKALLNSKDHPHPYQEWIDGYSMLLSVDDIAILLQRLTIRELQKFIHLSLTMEVHGCQKLS